MVEASGAVLDSEAGEVAAVVDDESEGVVVDSTLAVLVLPDDVSDDVSTVLVSDVDVSVVIGCEVVESVS